MTGVVRAKWPFSIYDFADGTLNGWSNVGGGVEGWTAQTGNDNGTGYHVPYYAVSFVTYATRDGATSTFWLRSPQFKILIPNAPLTFWISGGVHGTPPANESSVPTGQGATAGGVQFIGLRDVATGNFVRTAQHSGNNANWEGKAFDVSAFLNDGKFYTLDAIDYYAGGWGWFSFGRVRIPGW